MQEAPNPNQHKEPLQVLHLEMPRSLSFSVKPWRQSTYRSVVASSHLFEQRDLNISFWRWLLQARGADLIEKLQNTAYQKPSVSLAAMTEIAERIRALVVPDGEVNLFGLQLDPDISSDTTALLHWVQLPSVKHWLFPWLKSVDALFSSVDIVSFGVGSPEELALAAVTAEYLRQEHPNIHSCLSHHRWENYSLAPKLEPLILQGKLLELFDSVSLREDLVGESLSSLCLTLQTGQLDQLQNIGTILDGEPTLIGQSSSVSSFVAPAVPPDAKESAAISRFLNSLSINPANVLMLETLVRNDCHYGKCTFCVQNIGYPSHQQYKHAPELDRSLSLVTHLAREHGIRAYSFVDQAIPTALLNRLAKRLEALELPIKWCCRMLPEHADIDSALMCTLRKLGCSEILIGLESTCPTTLEKMGKSSAFSTEKAQAWITRCKQAGIDITLSTIQGFPTESAATFDAHTGQFLKDCLTRNDNISVIVNQFALFDGSPMAKSYREFGIAELLPMTGDMNWTIDYIDEFQRDSRNVNPTAFQPLLGRDSPAPEMIYFHYASIGLLYRWTNKRWLIDDISSHNAAANNAFSQQGNSLFPKRDELILGSEGFLGFNLSRNRPQERLILSSKRDACGHYRAAPYISEDISMSYSKLSQLSPKTVWLCARPYSDDFALHAKFSYHLELLLTDWAEKGSLQNLIIFSTQLVASTPAANEQVNGESPLAPEAAYDFAKAKLEIFGGFLARKYKISVTIIRLPLLWGGYSLEQHKETQLLHQWRQQLSNGAYWNIRDEQRHFGNSWVNIDDLITAINAEMKHQKTKPALSIRTVKSGDFTYAQLQDAWGNKREKSATAAKELPLAHSRFMVKDEIGLPQRDMFVA